MPVSIDEFESGEFPDGPSVPEQVIRYLVSNRDHAFTRSEIAAAIDENTNTVGTALTRLKGRGLVRHRGDYWAVTDDDGRIESAYDIHTVTERLNAEDGGIDPDEWNAVAPDEPHASESGRTEES